MHPTLPPILTIAGSDPSGGAGIQTDIKSIMANGGYAMGIPTVLTAQNTSGVTHVFPIPPSHIKAQLDTLLKDIRPAAIKLGALGNIEIVEVIVEALTPLNIPIVWDPIIHTTSGTPLITENTIDLALETLIPICHLITPNVKEFERLYPLRQPISPCLITNGDSEGSIITDILIRRNEPNVRYTHPKHFTKNTHGTGCTLSSAITTYLGRGLSVERACQYGIEYTQKLLETSNIHNIGQGRGALYHEQHIKPFRS